MQIIPFNWRNDLASTIEAPFYWIQQQNRKVWYVHFKHGRRITDDAERFGCPNGAVIREKNRKSKNRFFFHRNMIICIHHYTPDSKWSSYAWPQLIRRKDYGSSILGGYVIMFIVSNANEYDWGMTIFKQRINMYTYKYRIELVKRCWEQMCILHEFINGTNIDTC